MALRKFIIERDIPKVGTFERAAARRGGEVERSPAPAGARHPVAGKLCCR